MINDQKPRGNNDNLFPHMGLKHVASSVTHKLPSSVGRSLVGSIMRYWFVIWLFNIIVSLIFFAGIGLVVWHFLAKWW
jgi:hypothetical protein